MESHVRECEECRRLLAGLRALLGMLHGLRAPSAVDPARMVESVRARLAGPPGQR
jgi:predicted anti-sigma-YlaC factor YlaD